ncbi:MAG TPA: zf-HC2 domain-containing protein [Longimicrobiales bacterium]
MSERCEWMRDRLPAITAGRLDAQAAAEVRSHLSACADCSAEAVLVRALAAHEVPVPEGLEARVRAAVAGQHESRGAGWRSPGRYAMAATVAFALVTAGLLRDATGGDERIALDPEAANGAGGAAAGDLGAPAWPAVDEPLMRGGPALYELSVDELERLLKELES